MSKIQKTRSIYGVDEYKLENGLRVLYKRVTAAPVVCVCITFHVGSRNESAGRTGATHILEHLLFKDSKEFNAKNDKAITGYLEWMGAYVNASTWMDRTNYYELLPKEKMGEALALEADRMRNSLFSDADLASEMTVVRNEYERSRNNPFELLDEEVMLTAFTKHPYRIPTIGTKEDIENSTASKLREFYDTFYWPNNATLSVFGDVSRSELEKLVVRYFAPLPRSPHPIPKLKVVEPRQTKARAVSLSKPMGIDIATLAYKIPAATHKDFSALLVATIILAGGFSSRLQKALVDTGVAADIGVFALPLHDPGLASFSAHVAEGSTPNKAQVIMRREIRGFLKEGPSKEEVARAQARLLSGFAAERDGVMSESRALTEAIATGDWTLSYKLEKAVASMTPERVVAAAKKYFVPSQETAGVLHNKK